MQYCRPSNELILFLEMSRLLRDMKDTREVPREDIFCLMFPAMFASSTTPDDGL